MKRSNFPVQKLASAFIFLTGLPLIAGAETSAVAGQPLIVEQTFWIRPGKEAQFVGLFSKSRVPSLRAEVKEGRALWVRVSTPQFNAGNEQWDLRVTVAWRDSGSASALGSALTRSVGSSQRLATEQQLMEELILERSEVPVQELSVTDVGT